MDAREQWHSQKAAREAAEKLAALAPEPAGTPSKELPADKLYSYRSSELKQFEESCKSVRDEQDKRLIIIRADWRRAFEARMGFDAAADAAQERDDFRWATRTPPPFRFGAWDAGFLALFAMGLAASLASSGHINRRAIRRRRMASATAAAWLLLAFGATVVERARADERFLSSKVSLEE